MIPRNNYQRHEGRWQLTDNNKTNPNQSVKLNFLEMFRTVSLELQKMDVCEEKMNTLWHNSKQNIIGITPKKNNIKLNQGSPCSPACSGEPSACVNERCKAPSLIRPGVKFPLSPCQIGGFNEVDPYLTRDKGKCWGRNKEAAGPRAHLFKEQCWPLIGWLLTGKDNPAGEPQIFMSMPN